MIEAVGITPFDVSETEIDGLYVLTAKQVEDERGTVREFYRESAFRDAGLASLGPWVQVNMTWTRHGAVRGLHGEHVSKLVGLAAGEALGAYVDARPGSPSWGKVVTLDLRVGTQVLVPVGVCNGFQSVSRDGTQYLYCFDVEWTPGMTGVAVNAFDRALGIPWPVEVDRSDRSLLSERDAALPSFDEAFGQLKP
jgi:dTDP-4-dehydrorhamnose 3,5-epimerase